VSIDLLDVEENVQVKVCERRQKNLLKIKSKKFQKFKKKPSNL